MRKRMGKKIERERKKEKEREGEREDDQASKQSKYDFDLPFLKTFVKLRCFKYLAFGVLRIRFQKDKKLFPK